MNKKSFAIIIVLWLIIQFSAIFCIVNQHELTHQAIYRYFGYNASVHLNMFGGYTQIELNQIINETDFKIIQSLQAVNELVSYQYGIFFAFVTGSFLLFLIILDSFTSQIVKLLNLVQRFEEMEKAKKLPDVIEKQLTPALEQFSKNIKM